MFRLWAKEFKDNRMLRDTTICDESEDTRTHKVFHALDEVCYEFDLSKPIWLDSTIQEFKRHAKARFHQDNFVDSIDNITQHHTCHPTEQAARSILYQKHFPDIFQTASQYLDDSDFFGTFVNGHHHSVGNTDSSY